MTTSAAPAAVQEQFGLLETRMKVMKHHAVFSSVKTIEHLQIFMQWHVFAVWDFMSLVKRLQLDFTHTALPWLPPQHPKAARLINEIVLGEETDETLAGGNGSHFEMYLQAMREVGASTQPIERFIDLLTTGETVPAALQRVNAPAAVSAFVQSTLDTACEGMTCEVLGSFFYGREDVIPQMFQCLLDHWAIDPRSAPTFVYYLQRHIELDGDSHGPAAQLIIAETLGNDATAWALMLNAAHAAVEQRINLWSALAEALEQIRPAAQDARVVGALSMASST